tara:strand:- start:206 stop:427 length:222 start_codon:yes stop_codon:yes gene_type:complete
MTVEMSVEKEEGVLVHHHVETSSFDQMYLFLISFFRIKKSETSKLYSPKLISKNQNIKKKFISGWDNGRSTKP